MINTNRPRERLEIKGPEALSDTELLAIILQKGTKEINVIELSNQLLKNGFNNLYKMSLNELRKIKGMGFAKACQIKALFELNNRYVFSKKNGKSIQKAKDVYEYFHPKLSRLEKEYFIVIHLDTKNKIIKEETISIGTLNYSVIHPREVFKSAIRESANAVIMIHNHPSGESEPSDEDLEVTKTLIEAGELLSIKILDHIIIGRDSYYSFAEKGLM